VQQGYGRFDLEDMGAVRHGYRRLRLMVVIMRLTWQCVDDRFLLSYWTWRNKDTELSPNYVDVSVQNRQ
jgi:hypothetical protein